MNLNTVHQILIGSAIGVAVIYGLRGIVLSFQGDGAISAVRGGLSIVVAVVLGLYLKQFREKLRAASDREEPKSE
jgi:hypothetical protein